MNNMMEGEKNIYRTNNPSSEKSKEEVLRSSEKESRKEKNKKKIAAFLEKEHEPIVERYLRNSEAPVSIGISTPGDELNAITRWKYMKSVNPNLEVVETPEEIWSFLKIFLPLAKPKERKVFIDRIDKILALGGPIDETKEEREQLMLDSLDPTKDPESYLSYDLYVRPVEDKICESLGIIKGDAKKLEVRFKKGSVDLILALGLFGQLDVASLESGGELLIGDSLIRQEFLEHRKAEIKKILKSYNERVEKVIKSIYSVLRPKGIVIISNQNKEKLVVSNDKSYDLNYYKNKFEKEGFKIEKIYQGKERYLMICKKEEGDKSKKKIRAQSKLDKK